MSFAEGGQKFTPKIGQLEQGGEAHQNHGASMIIRGQRGAKSSAFFHRAA